MSPKPPSHQSATRPRVATPLTGVVLTLLIATQPAHPQPALTPVDPGSSDISPLARGRRDLRVDLRTPVGFENLYQLNPNIKLFPGQPTGDAGNGPFVRISGGLIAIFPRSTYQATDNGAVIATIPPGTVFFQGDARRLLTDSTPRARAAWSGATAFAGEGRERMAMRSLLQPLTPTVIARKPQAGPMPADAAHVVRSAARSAGYDDAAERRTIWTDEPYRQQRIARLLEVAFEAGAATRPAR